MVLVTQAPTKTCTPWWSGAGFCAVQADALGSVELRTRLHRMAQLGASAIWLQTMPGGEAPGNLQAVITLAHALGLKVIVELTLLTSGTACPQALHAALNQAMLLKADAVSIPAAADSEALAPALNKLARTPPGFALLGAAGESRMVADMDGCKNKLRWLNTVDVHTTTLADLHAPVLHSQIRQALRSAGPAAIVWNTSPPATDHNYLDYPPDSAMPPQARYLAQALFSCLKGAFRMDIQTLGAGCSAPQQLMRFLQWQNQIAAFQHGSLKLLPSHKQLLAFMRTRDEASVLCVFNLSDRYVRHSLPSACRDASLLAGSGMQGGRIVDGHLDLDPWGALFARF